MGTPTFFINGKVLVGAQPFATFKARVDQAILDADALMEQKHIPSTKVYEVLMKDAKERTPPPGGK